MNVELPSDDPPDHVGNIPLADGKGKMNLFRLMCTFSIIQSHVYKRLYSVKATKQTDGELLNTIGELDKELETWKDGIPLEFRPEHDIKASHTPLILQVAVLHLGYYNCLTTIHRMSVHHGYWTSRLSNFAIQGLNARPLNPRVFMSAQLCVQAARASIHLLKYIPKGDQSCVWLIIYFPVTALVTLFANILQNPQDTRSRSDLKLMKLVVSFLSLIKNEQGNGSVKRMLSVCTEFERIAAIVLDKTDREHASRRKRKQGDSEQDAEIAATERELLNQNRNGPQSPPTQGTSPQPNQPQEMIFNPDFHGFNEVRLTSSTFSDLYTNVFSALPLLTQLLPRQPPTTKPPLLQLLSLPRHKQYPQRHATVLPLCHRRYDLHGRRHEHGHLRPDLQQRPAGPLEDAHDARVGLGRHDGHGVRRRRLRGRDLDERGDAGFWGRRGWD